MKKHFLSTLFFSLLLVGANATITIVEVTSNQFNPSNIPNVVVGDTIRYHFISGFHNAVSTDVANGVPAGAAEINSGDPSGINPRDYDYPVTVAGDYKYICFVHGNAQDFSGMKGTFTAGAALPAILKSFSMTTSKDKKPQFTWVSLTEENVSHYSLRASYDGYKYIEVGKVFATGNSSAEQTYSFTDNSVPAKYKYVYYMLAAVDKDGREKLSEVKMFKNLLSAPKLITQIGPNPIQRPGQLMIQFNSEKEGQILARVIDANGKFVMQTQMAAFPGLNSGHVHVCDLPAGTYNIQFTLDGIKETKKVVVY